MPRMTLGEIARMVGGRLVGEDRPITGVRPLEEAGPEDLSFLANPKYRARLEDCRAGGILVTPDVSSSRLSLVRVDRPYVALARVMPLFYPPRRPPAGIDPKSDLAADCQLGREVSVGPFVVAGPGCRIGDRTVLMAGVSLGPEVRLGADCLIYPSVSILERCEVGSRVIIHAGAVVGSDGFGFAEENGAHLKIPQVGNVVIEDDVEIGANVTLDRATFGSTRIRAGTKIDNLVQIGHNCDVGENSLLVAQVGLSGSVRVGRGVIFAGQSGSVGHVHIGDGSRVGAKSAVTTNLPEGSFVIGHPARDHREWKKAQAGLNRLPELRARVRFLEGRLEELAGRTPKKEG
jgi:UDP-3-O-[3-hydroxymyristoyl] glucosamine N-acyltransferase